jgi:hypothetical protein
VTPKPAGQPPARGEALDERAQSPYRRGRERAVSAAELDPRVRRDPKELLDAYAERPRP